MYKNHRMNEEDTFHSFVIQHFSGYPKFCPRCYI